MYFVHQHLFRLSFNALKPKKVSYLSKGPKGLKSINKVKIKKKWGNVV